MVVSCRLSVLLAAFAALSTLAVAPACTAEYAASGMLTAAADTSTIADGSIVKTCKTAADCNDGNSCTTEVCSAGTCSSLLLTGCTVPCDAARPCTSGTCDLESNSCVACLGDGDCEPDQLCLDRSCVPLTECASDLDCKATGRVCQLPQGQCVECVGDGDCEPGQACQDRRCVARLPCTSSKQCPSVCSKQHGYCVACEISAHCLPGYWCDKQNTCRPAVCTVGACAGGAHFACLGVNAVFGKGADCGDDNPCTTDLCDPQKGCSATPASGDCDDGDPCTVAGKCAQGTCLSSAKPCSDGNPCTYDTCVPLKGCVFSPSAAACDDGDLCTNQDACSAGGCLGKPVNCDDGDPCSLDECVAASGCAHKAATGPTCNDGNACTASDICVAGNCIGAATPCDDGLSCTADLCAPQTGCQHAPVPGPCDDGNLCTSGDSCSAGVCQGQALECSDGIACTVDSCAPAGNCLHVSSDSACDDAELCTDDSCITGQGCVHQANLAACNDGNACTIGDVCKAGQCGGPDNLNCDDGKVCTDDFCLLAKGCVHTNSVKGCDDGDPCTASDACAGGNCVGKAKLAERFFSYAGAAQLAGIAPGPDSGFVVSGFRFEGNSVYNAWMMGLDLQGNVLWDKTYPGVKAKIKVVAQAEGYLMAGVSGDSSVGLEPEVWLAKADAKGAPLWQKTYGPGYGEVQIAAAESGVAVVTSTKVQTPSGKSTDLVILRVDGSGKLLWQKQFGAPGADNANAIIALPDGWLVAGASNFNPAGGALAATLTRFDAAGTIVWQKSYGGTTSSALFALALLGDGYLAVGSSYQADAKVSSANKLTVLRLDTAGALVWQTQFAAQSGIQPIAALPMPSGFTVVTGTGSWRLGPAGDLLWVHKTTSYAQAALALPDGIALAGYSQPTGGNSQGWFVRTDDFANTLCSKSGSCAGIAAPSCDDGNPCTIDLCAAASGGCSHANLPMGTGCGDGKTCTPSDACALGSCPSNSAPICRETPADMQLIPAGAFQMGCVAGDSACLSNESPQHEVTLAPYYIGVYEVSVDDYKVCVEAGKCSLPANIGSVSNWWNAGKGHYPVNGISWQQAAAYCQFLGPKVRLPTEAEWERAARGGLQGKKYPWGDSDPVCVSGKAESAVATGSVIGSGPPGASCSSNISTQPVGTFGLANGYGLHDMAGNVWEWTADWYGPGYYASSPVQSPPGPSSGSSHVARGGGQFSKMAQLRASHRGFSLTADSQDGIGIRCAAEFP